MGRLVVLVLLGLLVAWWVGTRIARARNPERRVADKPAKGSAPVSAAHQGMVACAHCGLHVPRDEASMEGQRSFCSDEHRRLGAR